MATPLIYIPGSAPKPKVQQEMVGRPMGKPHGSYVCGLAEVRQTIWLCRMCAHNFDYKKYNYYREKYYVVGKCDACRNQNARNKLFIHESYLAGPGGRSKHGHCWIPA